MVACKKPAGGDVMFLSKRDVSKYNEIVTYCDGGGPIYLTRTGGPYRELYKEPYRFRFPTFKQWLGIGGFLGLKSFLVLIVALVFHGLMVDNANIPHTDPLVVRTLMGLAGIEFALCAMVFGIMGLIYLGEMAMGREV